ncbi:MAG: CDGSH iron-sulfur domain-containing protein [Halanaeroarchaeum sp.]
MAREITHEATGPRYLTEDDLDEEKGDVAICMCGLSAEYPFCDGSHRATADEESGVRYKYEGDDDENPRHEIAEVIFADDRDHEV